MSTREIVEQFLKKNYLVSPDVLSSVTNIDDFSFYEDKGEKPIVVTKDVFFVANKNKKPMEINWLEFEKSRVLYEKGKDNKIYESFLEILSFDGSPQKKQIVEALINEIKQQPEIIIEKEEETPNVIITKCYVDESIKEKKVSDFVQYFKNRYNKMRDILMSREELQNSLSIKRILQKKDRDKVSLIGLIQNKYVTKNGHVMLKLEDPTGLINVLINKEKGETYSLAQNLVLDSAIGAVGVSNGEIVFANNIYLPDIPQTKELKKSENESWVAFISDIHVGSKNFLEKEFLKFIKWLNLGLKENIEIASKLNYLIIAGDNVDGVGIYPGQDRDLAINDVRRQYDKLADYLSLIRKDIHIVIAPGNHDAVRLTQPQPTLDKKYAESLFDIPQLNLVTNPSVITLHATRSFPGFDVLIFHGYSYHYYADNVESLRKIKARNHPKEIMKYMLQLRHLGPTHTSTLYIPDTREDPLIIDRIPDIFVSGELHKPEVGSYNGVVTIGCSCWQSVTDYELKMGNSPDPCKVVVMNLKTREIKILDFNEK